MTNQYLPKHFDVFMGIDVDKNSFSFTARDHDIMNRSKKIPSNPESLYNYIRNQFPDKSILCAYEAGPTGFGLYDYLISKQIDCMVVSPLSIPKAPNQKVKNNRLDSERIAEELKAGKLQPIRVPEGPYRELRHLVSLRANYVQQGRIAKQRIRSLLLYANIDLAPNDSRQSWSNSYLKSLRKLECNPALRHRLDMLLMDVEYARRQLLTVLKELKAFYKKNLDIDAYRRYAQSVPGIGLIIALTLLGRSGNPAQLKNVRELAAFLGLVPSEKSTGDTVQRGYITHLGNAVLRSMIIEASWIAIRKDSELNQFYHRIKARHHPQVAAKKAIVAVARKLTQRLYCVLKEQRMYIVR